MLVELGQQVLSYVCVCHVTNIMQKVGQVSRRNILFIASLGELNLYTLEMYMIFNMCVCVDCVDMIVLL